MDDDKQLFIKCLEGNMPEVKMMLARGGDPNKKVGTIGQTTLIAAAGQGHQEVVGLLLEQPGISVNAADDGGQTALHWAANNGYQEVVALLLEHPEIDAKATTNGRGNTILHSACYFDGGPDILRRLLAHPDTDPNVKDMYGSTPIMVLLQRNYDIDIQRGRLQALVGSDKVDLDVKDPQGRSLEDLAR